jgi:hypothetical protein
MPGPVPKRSTERRRRNADSKPDTVAAPGAPLVEAPATPEGLHEIAAEWFESLKTSGQALYYEPSDWATAKFVAREMSRLLANRFSAQGFAAVMAAMTELLTTEGARRRARIEIQRGPASDEIPDGVAALDDYRQALGG